MIGTFASFFSSGEQISNGTCEDAVTTMPPTTLPNTSGDALLYQNYFTTTAEPLIAQNFSTSIENEDFDEELDISSGPSSLAAVRATPTWTLVDELH